MKLIITAKDNDLDMSVDMVVEIASKIRGFEWVDCDCREDGTSLILEK
jgi:hypothetical protein